MTKTILLADDSVTIQKVVELTFMDQDYQVIAVSDGAAALAKLGQMQPDLLIADVHMPEANGYEVCRHAKKTYPGIPVLLLVGTFEPFDQQQAHSVGADSHLKKPFDSQDLLRQVDNLISQTAPPAAAAPAPAPAPPPAAAASSAAPELPMFDLSEPEPLTFEPEPPRWEPPPAPPIFEPEPLELDEPELLELEPEPLDLDPEPFELEPEPPELDEPEPPELEPEPPAPEPAAPAKPMWAVATAKPAEVDAGAGSAPAEPARGNGTLSEEDVERIARRVVELVGDSVIRQVAWEVVPDLAEVVIRERIRELEGQVE